MENKNHIYTCKYWTDEKNKWLIDNTSGMKRADAYALWCKHWPNENKSEGAVNNQRSRLKCASYTRIYTHSTKIKPLYTERIKTGYWQIKVALPNVWWSKAKWVWINTHPDELDSLLETDCFYFADGNRDNFNYENIIRLHRNEQTIFQLMGGIVPGNPELTKLHLIMAKHKLAILDAAERCGDVVNHRGCRVIREDFNAKARAYHRYKYHNDSKYKQRIKEQHARYNAKRTEEQKQHRREYAKEWKCKQVAKAKEKENENKDMQETGMQ